jgi:AraC family transcriptional regulator, transcriptional activator of pobA
MKNITIRYLNGVQEPFFSESFSIRDVQDLLGGKDMVQELHRHDFFYILAVEKGSGKHEIDFTPYEIRDHSLFFMRPGQVHQLTLKARSTGYLVAFNLEFYRAHHEPSNQLLRNASSANHYKLDSKRFGKILSSLTNIFHEYSNKQEGYQRVIQANLEILFTELVRQNSKSLPNTASPYTQARLEEFLKLLEVHVATHKRVSEYADMLNLSTYQLNAITKTTRGKTCSELIDEYIMLESKRYLLATSDQVSQIAHHLGYEDASYFIRFFKKHAGHSPEAFRNNFK